MDQSDLEFLIPSDDDTYIELDIKLYIRGKFTRADGTALDNTDFRAVTDKFLHSLFGQCSIALNELTINQVAEIYNYHSFLKAILKYGIDAATSHLTNAFWYLDNGDQLPCAPTASDAKNKGFITRWDLLNRAKR